MVQGRTTSGMGRMRKLGKLWLPRTPGDRRCHLERGNGAEEDGDGEITTWDGEMDVGTGVCVNLREFMAGWFWKKTTLKTLKELFTRQGKEPLG